MYRKVLAAGATAAAIVGAGGTALALTGSNGTGDATTTTSNVALTNSSAEHPRAKARLFRHLSHGQFVTHTKKGFVTHDVIRGTVTAVSPTSITVQAADKTSLTFVVDDRTKVKVRRDGHGMASSIAQVTKGDQVLVAGTGTSTSTAKHVVDVKK
jgi:preprotein translocase subunit YajC